MVPELMGAFKKGSSAWRHDTELIRRRPYLRPVATALRSTSPRLLAHANGVAATNLSTRASRVQLATLPLQTSGGWIQWKSHPIVKP